MFWVFVKTLFAFPFEINREANYFCVAFPCMCVLIETAVTNRSPTVVNHLVLWPRLTGRTRSNRSERMTSRAPCLDSPSPWQVLKRTKNRNSPVVLNTKKGYLLHFYCYIRTITTKQIIVYVYIYISYTNLGVFTLHGKYTCLKLFTFPRQIGHFLVTFLEQPRHKHK